MRDSGVRWNYKKRRKVFIGTHTRSEIFHQRYRNGRTQMCHFLLKKRREGEEKKCCLSIIIGHHRAGVQWNMPES